MVSFLCFTGTYCIHKKVCVGLRVYLSLDDHTGKHPEACRKRNERIQQAVYGICFQ